jgi:hypothetical protein
VRISPHQPVFGITGLAWENGGCDVALRFAGDVFKMEDQRNWTDASFKTYSRPLARPFPYRIGPGERVRQSVTIEARTSSGPIRSETGPARIALIAGGVFPSIAVGAATAPDPAPDPDDTKPVGSEVLVELDPGSPTWRAALRIAAGNGLPFDVRFILGLATTVTPLFHALGTEQLIESVAMQRLVAEQTVSYSGGMPVHIGPVCLRPRFNNVTTTEQPRPAGYDLTEGYGAEFTGFVDARQTAPELAAWAIGSATASGTVVLVANLDTVSRDLRITLSGAILETRIEPFEYGKLEFNRIREGPGRRLSGVPAGLPSQRPTANRRSQPPSPATRALDPYNGSYSPALL